MYIEYLKHIADNVPEKKDQAIKVKKALNYLGKVRKGQINNFWKCRDKERQENAENIQALKLLKAYGTIENCTNEAEKSELIENMLYLVLMVKVLDFTIKQGEDILCVIEAKSQNIEHGFAQNFVQLQAACQNKKRKRNESEYVYRVVTTGEKWFFTIVTTSNQIGAINEPIMIHLSSSNIETDVLKKDIGALFLVLGTIILDKITSAKQPKTKIQWINRILNS
ncbi:hypothetical protein C2G38_2033567 [Gigaspora rosea]|uniref:Uncharacterized protein n=1 Tax=Gigaspora rosea TaxID=44941 RepID=A0A397VKG7_9GLOM|nr:hypothetical protein C2G38_2033567 [Gigaspora rosea]